MAAHQGQTHQFACTPTSKLVSGSRMLLHWQCKARNPHQHELWFNKHSQTIMPHGRSQIRDLSVCVCVSLLRATRNVLSRVLSGGQMAVITHTSTWAHLDPLPHPRGHTWTPSHIHRSHLQQGKLVALASSVEGQTVCCSQSSGSAQDPSKCTLPHKFGGVNSVPPPPNPTAIITFCPPSNERR